MKKLFLIVTIILSSCTTEQIQQTADTTRAAESVLICGTWTFKNLVARPVVNALNVVPFFAGVPQPCPEPTEP